MDVLELLPKLIRSCLEQDRKAVEATTVMIIRKIKKEKPDIAAEISKALSYSGFEGGFARSIDMQPLPVDKETRFPLVKLEEPTEMLDPVLDEYTRKQLNDFINERSLTNIFLEEDIVPPNSILLDGSPGVGKTYIAKWMSYKLNLPLVVLDLASSISSFLGRSGQNIRYIFDYAKAHNSILFLDELDAIAKRRDDLGDLGELKRLVNVLLKELESCPTTCVIIAATNHPELLDKAIWRRFDRNITIEMPGEQERKALLTRHLGKLTEQVDNETLEFLAKSSSAINAADICKLCEHIKRQSVMNPQVSKSLIALSELFKISRLTSKEEKTVLCRKLKASFPDLSQREIADITQISLTSVSRYLANSKEELK